MSQSSIASIASTPSINSSSSFTSTSATLGETIQVATTITSSSSICVATLQAQLLGGRTTALIVNANGSGYVTLGQSCVSTSISNVSPATTTVYQSYSASEGGNHESTRLSNGAIIGTVIAVVSFITIVSGVVGLLWWTRRRRTLRRAATLPPPKAFDSDSIDGISSSWEKDGTEIKEISADGEIMESNAAEIKEMSCVCKRARVAKGPENDRWMPSPISPLESATAVEIGDSRSIRNQAFQLPDTSQA